VFKVAEHPHKLLFNTMYRYVAVFKENKNGCIQQHRLERFPLQVILNTNTTAISRSALISDVNHFKQTSKLCSPNKKTTFCFQLCTCCDFTVALYSRTNDKVLASYKQPRISVRHNRREISPTEEGALCQ